MVGAVPVYAEGHEDRAGSAPIHGEAFDEAEQQFGFTVLVNRTGTDLVTGRESCARCQEPPRAAMSWREAIRPPSAVRRS